MSGSSGSTEMRRTVVVFDTTLRDGGPAAGVCFSKSAKVEIAGLLDAMGVDVIEAGFPSASAGEARGGEVAREVRRRCGLARAIASEIDTSWLALRFAPGAAHIHVFLSSSEIHLAHSCSARRRWRVQRSRGRGTWPTSSSARMNATRAEPALIASLVRAAMRAGATTINVPDTVGCAPPDQVDAMFRELLGGCRSWRPGDSRSTGRSISTANALAAIAAGARQVELAVNGLGDSGNTSFEEVVMALRVHRDALRPHRGHAGRLRLAGGRAPPGLAVAANKAIVGGNAFRHASGIHRTKC